MIDAEARPTQEVEERTREWATAELNGDTRTLGRLLTDDFIGIGPFGFMLTKEQWLDRYRPDGLRNNTFALDETRVRTYGDAAIVTGRQVQSGSYQGKALPPGGRATLIWVQGNGGWQLAGWHLSPIAPGPGR
jgi:ketosteroid isomerase-like protein